MHGCVCIIAVKYLCRLLHGGVYRIETPPTAYSCSVSQRSFTQSYNTPDLSCATRMEALSKERSQQVLFPIQNRSTARTLLRAYQPMTDEMAEARTTASAACVAGSG